MEKITREKIAKTIPGLEPLAEAAGTFVDDLAPPSPRSHVVWTYFHRLPPTPVPSEYTWTFYIPAESRIVNTRLDRDRLWVVVTVLVPANNSVDRPQLAHPFTLLSGGSPVEPSKWRYLDSFPCPVTGAEMHLFTDNYPTP